MRMFDGAVDDVERQFGAREKFPDILAVGRCVNPPLWGLGALALDRYLLTAHPATPVSGPPFPVFGMQMAPSAPVPAPLAISSDTTIVSHSSTTPDEAVRRSTICVLKAVSGAVLAVAWPMIGAWLGLRHARALPADEPVYDGSAPTDSMVGSACAPLRGPTCQRMYDETCLLPHYIRCAEFPAMKQDLLRLAEVYTDQGLTLRRLERLPDRRYSSLHDLITEIYVD